MNTQDSRPASSQIREYMPIVRRVAAQVARRLPPSIPREDLVAAGTFGLYEALQKGVPENPAVFAAYASIRIRGAIFDELRRLDWFPRRRRAKAVEPSTAASGAPAAPGAQVRELRVAPARTLVPLDDVENEAPANGEHGTPADQVEQKAALGVLHDALGALPERERMILKMRYFDEVSGKELASALGLSEARVSQLHSRALDRLRKNDTLRRDLEGEELPLAA